MRKYIISLLVSFLISSLTFAQCNLTVSQTEFNICEGTPVQLSSSIICADTLDDSNFNSGSLNVGWFSPSSPMFTNPCGAGSDGSTYLWIGPASTFPREVISTVYVVSDSVDICFDMTYASQSNSTPCEGPDMATEGVHFQYSNTGQGGPWVDLGYWDPLGGYDPIMTSWNRYCFHLITSGNVWFRWYQDVTSGNDFDHWGLDNVTITTSNYSASNGNTVWNTANGLFYNGQNPPLFYPDSSMWLTVTYTNLPIILSDTVFITVYDSIPLSFSGLMDTICHNEMPVALTGIPAGGTFSGSAMQGNLFNPSLASAGMNTIYYNYYTIINDTINGLQPVFYDDFSTDKGWTGYGVEWSRGPAVASVGCSGAQDPSQDNTASTLDNNIIGNYIGGCYPNSMNQTYWLSSPIINCSNFNTCSIQFYSLSGCESASFDHMYIEVSGNGGLTWNSLYANISTVSESSWTFREYPVSIANNNSSFMVRFGMGSTDGSVNYNGWNIDDFSVNCYGQMVYADTLCNYRVTDSVFVQNCTTISDPLSDNIYLSISPNPACTSLVKVEWRLPENAEALSIEMYNLLGERLAIKKINTNEGKLEFDISDFPKSIYEICVTGTNGYRKSTKLVKH
ncbi:MAG: T9SS type A sorting domain-containing protein [Bacteroidia bacterium]|nr:T9SS type A sorting domain-containing protein [Bacteroidia bacterium]